MYEIHSPIANNIHHFWDQGGGLFHMARAHYPLSIAHVEQLATQLQGKYTKSDFTQALEDQKPYHWAHESYILAKRDAYQVSFGGSVSQAYQARAEYDGGQRVVLAGLRLAWLLNQLFE